MRAKGTAEEAVARSLPPGRAAQELELRRGEFDLAVQLGHIRTTRGAGGVGCWRTTRTRSSGTGRVWPRP
jgi:hypothetical protein